MDDDWDLHAVVRGCAAVTTTTSAAVQVVTSTQECNFPAAAAAPCFQDLFQPSRRENLAQNQLHDLYKPFFHDSSSRNIVFSPQSMPINSPVTVLGGGLRDPPAEPPPPPPLQIVKPLPQPQTQLRQIQQPFSVSNVSKASVSHNPTSRSKKSKNHMKKVCHVAAENLSSDVWSWRKYGQKPIKGSPYPRGYYRCSTSKGCMARKQVERNRSDPGMFIVTYTAEHNHPMPTHRNSLAGSSRQKPAEVGTPASDEPNKPSCSPEMSPAASLSSAPEKLESSREVEEEDDDDFSVSNMALEDDFFVGLEDFTAADGGDECDSGHFPAGVVDFPWLSSSATTIAGGG